MDASSEERNLGWNWFEIGLKFVSKVFRKQDLNFCEEDVGFSLDGAGVTHKMNDFDQDRAPRAIS